MLSPTREHDFCHPSWISARSLFSIFEFSPTRELNFCSFQFFMIFCKFHEIKLSPTRELNFDNFDILVSRSISDRFCSQLGSQNTLKSSQVDAKKHSILVWKFRSCFDCFSIDFGWPSQSAGSIFKLNHPRFLTARNAKQHWSASFSYRRPTLKIVVFSKGKLRFFKKSPLEDNIDL